MNDMNKAKLLVDMGSSVFRPIDSKNWSNSALALLYDNFVALEIDLFNMLFRFLLRISSCDLEGLEWDFCLRAAPRPGNALSVGERACHSIYFVYLVYDELL